MKSASSKSASSVKKRGEIDNAPDSTVAESRRTGKRKKKRRLLPVPRQHITMPELIKELHVPPGKRTAHACKKMAGALHAFIRSIPAFKVGFHTTDALAVAKHAELQTVGLHEAVFLQGEVGHEFYFVLEGFVNIELDKKVIKVLGEKTSFGEISMQFKCKRSASVTGAVDGTQLLVIRKHLYHRHLAMTHRQEMLSKLEFIKKLRAHRMNHDEIPILCTCIKELKVKLGQSICSHDKPGKFLYYLIKGCADEHSYDNGKRLKKIVHAEESAEAKKFSRLKRSASDSPQHIIRLSRKRIALEQQIEGPPVMHRLATLLTGQMFGEASWAHGQEAMTTVRARSGCRLWVLPFSSVNRLCKTHSEVRTHLQKVAFMKLKFRISRFDTLRRANRCLNSGLKSGRGRAASKSMDGFTRLSAAWEGTGAAKTDTAESKTPSFSISIDVVKESKAEDTDADAAPLKLNPNTPKAKFMPRVHQASSIKKGNERKLIGSFSIAETDRKPLPKVTDGDRIHTPRSNLKASFRQYNINHITNRFKEKYSTSYRARTPRDILGTGDKSTELKYVNQQLVTTLDRYWNRKNSPRVIQSVQTKRPINLWSKRFDELKYTTGLVQTLTQV